MLNYFLIFAALTAIEGAQSVPTCNADFCDPNWTPFDNMVYALRGYNIKTGNPIQNNGDPGFSRQIFLPTKINNLGRIEMEAGITGAYLSFCQRSMTSRSFTTIDSYRKYIQESSRTGVDLQIGTDTEVTVGVSIKAVDISAKKTIPKPFERAWGNSREFTQLTEFFSQKQGLVSMSMGTCTMYELQLERYQLPPFTLSFKKALIELYETKDDADHIQKSAFRRFIQEYGTHFLLKSKMGAQYVYRTKFSKNARDSMNAETLKNCNYVKGSKIFGIQVEQDKSGCSQTDLEKMNKMSFEDIQSSIITKGSRPTDIEKWATQDFTPIPLRFELSPIINLFIDGYIGALKTNSGQSLTSLEIRKWFVPLYFDFCTSMNIDCGEKTGCGIDDKCPVDAICTVGGDSRHECTDWGQWSCTVNCGQGTQMKRTRQCFGCTGETEQIIDKTCQPQKECYKQNPRCYYEHTAWGQGSSEVYYLDRHKVECNNGYGIQSFQLQRDSSHRNYRYEYKCCETQLSCGLSTWYWSDISKVKWGSPSDLDGNFVTCSNYGFLGGFWLRRPSSGSLRYHYKCCAGPQLKDCKSFATAWTPNGGGDTVYLDRQNIECSAPYTLSSFWLQRNSANDRWRYHIICCKVLPN